MKKILLIITGLILIIGVGFIILLNLRSIYFFDGVTGETTKLTSFWLKQNEIEIKDRWFDDFEQDTISGIIFIEDDEEYAIIPYTFTKFNNDYDLAELYDYEHNPFYGVTWIEKSIDEPLSFEITNEQKLWVAVGTYSGTSYDETEFGMGVYSVPLYNNEGDLYFYMEFPTSSLASVQSGFNNEIPSYVLQEFLFIEISITNHDQITFLLPIEFVGGLLSSDIDGSDHYYYEYNGNQVIFEAILERVELNE